MTGVQTCALPIVPMEDGTERLYYSAMAGDGTWHVAALDLGAPPPYETGTEGN